MKLLNASLLSFNDIFVRALLAVIPDELLVLLVEVEEGVLEIEDVLI